MKIEKIEILTSNKKHATDIAMLVDKPEFIQELQRLREKWQIKELYKPKSLFGGIALLDTRNPLYYSSISKEESIEKLPEFNADIDKMLKVFKRGKNFRLVIIYALISGEIPEGIYQSCYFDVITMNEPEDLSKPENYQYVIVMSPRTEKQEVLEAFEEFKRHRAGKIKFHQPRISLDSPVTQEFTDAIECIEREKKICEEETKNLTDSEEILKALGKFLTNTEKAREYMLTIGELNIDIPDHKELIELYHRGNVYPSSDTEKFKTQKELDRAREWHWIRYRDFLSGTLKEPLSPGEVSKEWQNRCDMNKGLKLKDKKYCECQYCIYDPEIIMKSLSHYDNLLKFC